MELIKILQDVVDCARRGDYWCLVDNVLDGLKLVVKTLHPEHPQPMRAQPGLVEGFDPSKVTVDELAAELDEIVKEAGPTPMVQGGEFWKRALSILAKLAVKLLLEGGAA